MIRGAGNYVHPKARNPDPPKVPASRTGFASEISRAQRMRRAPLTWQYEDETAGVVVSFTKGVRVT
jgi:hypothetical protein